MTGPNAATAAVVPVNPKPKITNLKKKVLVEEPKIPMSDKQGPSSKIKKVKTIKKSVVKKIVKKVGSTKKPNLKKEHNLNPVSIPAFHSAAADPAVSAKLSVIGELDKKAIRRTALEVKEAEAMEEQKKSEQEKEWEIPAFLRKIKIK